MHSSANFKYTLYNLQPLDAAQSHLHVMIFSSLSLFYFLSELNNTVRISVTSIYQLKKTQTIRSFDSMKLTFTDPKPCKTKSPKSKEFPSLIAASPSEHKTTPVYPIPTLFNLKKMASTQSKELLTSLL